MRQIKDWNWITSNIHTLYGKMMLNLLENYIINDENVYIADVSKYEKCEDKMVCVDRNFLTKNLKNSILEDDNNKKEINPDEEIVELYPLGNYSLL